jgi:hypothetical protein
MAAFFKKFFSEFFSSKSNSSMSEFIMTKDGWMVLNPSSVELMKIENKNENESESQLCNVKNNIMYDVSNVMHPLNPLFMKTGNDLAITMMCFNM